MPSHNGPAVYSSRNRKSFERLKAAGLPLYMCNAIVGALDNPAWIQAVFLEAVEAKYYDELINHDGDTWTAIDDVADECWRWFHAQADA